MKPHELFKIKWCQYLWKANSISIKSYRALYAYTYSAVSWKFISGDTSRRKSGDDRTNRDADQGNWSRSGFVVDQIKIWGNISFWLPQARVQTPPTHIQCWNMKTSCSQPELCTGSGNYKGASCWLQVFFFLFSALKMPAESVYFCLRSSKRDTSSYLYLIYHKSWSWPITLVCITICPVVSRFPAARVSRDELSGNCRICKYCILEYAKQWMAKIHMFDLHDNCRALQLDVDCPQTHQRPILSVAPSHPEEPKECAS